jgi:hypothetical protein
VNQRLNSHRHLCPGYEWHDVIWAERGCVREAQVQVVDESGTPVRRRGVEIGARTLAPRLSSSQWSRANAMLLDTQTVDPAGQQPALRGPATKPLATYVVHEENSEIQIRL